MPHDQGHNPAQAVQDACGDLSNARAETFRFARSLNGAQNALNAIRGPIQPTASVPYPGALAADGECSKFSIAERFHDQTPFLTLRVVWSGGGGWGPALGVETAARALGISRTLAYQLAKEGNFPCQVTRIANTYRVATADLLRQLGVTRDSPDDPKPVS